jgi:hypothetical protein
MNLEIPEGAHIQILIAGSAFPALTDQVQRAPERLERRRSSRPIATTAVAMMLLAGGFLVGQHTRLAPATPAIASASQTLAGPPPVTKAIPDHALAGPAQPSPTAPMPSALVQQLQAPPTVVPPPGQPSVSAPTTKNAFGLDN